MSPSNCPSGPIGHTSNGSGFPDGHHTEYEQAQRTLFHVYWPLSTALGARFFYLGVLSVRLDVKRSLWASVGMYLGLVFTLLAIHHSLSGSLAHGGGA